VLEGSGVFVARTIQPFAQIKTPGYALLLVICDAAAARWLMHGCMVE
jgi:hypothetical protein